MVPSLSTGASAPAKVSVSSKLESVRMRRFLGVLTFLAVAAPIGPTAQPAAPDRAAPGGDIGRSRCGKTDVRLAVRLVSWDQRHRRDWTAPAARHPAPRRRR